MKKVLGYILTPIHHLVFALLLGLFHPIQWICLKLGGYSAHKKSVDVLNFFLVASYYLVGNRVKFNNPYPLPKNRSIIFVVNHQSLYDVPALIWFLRKYHAKFISKIELTKGIPSISFNLKYGGGANIDRKNPKQSISELLKLAERMRNNNWSTVIFPEGTRSRDGKMRSFSKAGLSTLIKKVPEALIVPITLKNFWKMTQYGLYPLSAGEDLQINILQPIEPKGREVEEVIAEAEANMKAALA